MITSTGKAITTEQVQSGCVLQEMNFEAASSGPSQLERMLITEDELKNTDIIFHQRPKCNGRTIFEHALVEWSDAYQKQVVAKDKRAVAGCLIADVARQGIRFVAVANRRKKLYEIKRQNDEEVIRKVVRALRKVCRAKEETTRTKSATNKCSLGSIQPPESSMVVSTTSSTEPDTQVASSTQDTATTGTRRGAIEHEGQCNDVESNVENPQDDTFVAIETPSWSKDTKVSTEETHEFLDFAADLDVYLSSEQMHSPSTCGKSTTAASLVNLSFPNPDSLQTNVHVPAIDPASTAKLVQQDLGGPAIDQDGDFLSVSPSIFDQAAMDSLGGSNPDFLRVESVRQKMLAPARRINKTQRKEAMMLACPFSVALPDMTPAEQLLSDALQSSYKAEQELSAALIRYERSITLNPLPRVLTGRKRRREAAFNTGVSSGLPQGWDHRAVASGVTNKIRKQN